MDEHCTVVDKQTKLILYVLLFLDFAKTETFPIISSNSSIFVTKQAWKNFCLNKQQSNHPKYLTFHSNTYNAQ